MPPTVNLVCLCFVCATFYSHSHQHMCTIVVRPGRLSTRVGLLPARLCTRMHVRPARLNTRRGVGPARLSTGRIGCPAPRRAGKGVRPARLRASGTCIIGHSCQLCACTLSTLSRSPCPRRVGSHVALSHFCMTPVWAHRGGAGAPSGLSDRQHFWKLVQRSCTTVGLQQCRRCTAEPRCVRHHGRWKSDSKFSMNC